MSVSFQDMLAAMSNRLSRRRLILVGVASNQLGGDLVEGSAGNLWLGSDIQERVARPQDKRGLPTRRNRTQSVPGVAGDQAYVRRLRLHCPSHSHVGFRCGLVAADLIIDAEPPLEDIQQAGSLELSPGNLGRVVGQREKPETGVSQFPKRVRYFRMRRH